MDSRQRDERVAAQRSLDFNSISIQAIRSALCYARKMLHNRVQRMALTRAVGVAPMKL